MKTKFIIAVAATVASAGILIASNAKKAKSEKGKNKKYQVISMKDGELTEYDTVISMNSNYTLEQFMEDKNIQSSNVDIIKVNGNGSSDFTFHSNDVNAKDKKAKVIVKSEIIHEEKIAHEEAKMAYEEVKIIAEMDDKGKLKAKKIVNGKEVELTEKELQELQEIHHKHEGKHGDHKVFIKMDIEDEKMEGLSEDIIKEVEDQIKDLDIDFSISERLNIDSIMELVHEKIEIIHSDNPGENEKVKVIVKEIDSDHKNGEHKVVIIENGEKKEWTSKDGNTVKVETMGGHEDFTIAIVTENYEESTKNKNTRVIRHGSQEMNVFPNPTEDVFRLKFEQKKKLKTNIEIRDLNGKVVYSEDLGKFSGEYNKEISLGKFGKGVYIVNIIAGKEQSARKVIIK